MTRPAISLFLFLPPLLNKPDILSPPHPVAKYCIIILIVVEVTQYTPSPLGNDNPRNPNISGIIHCIISLCAFCWGSLVVGVIIFCCAHIEAPVRTAMVRSGAARFNQRKLWPNGI